MRPKWRPISELQAELRRMRREGDATSRASDTVQSDNASSETVHGQTSGQLAAHGRPAVVTAVEQAEIGTLV